MCWRSSGEKSFITRIRRPCDMHVFDYNSRTDHDLMQLLETSEKDNGNV